jgi:hypothetical protein
MNNELERIRREMVVAKWSYYTGICLEGQRKTTNKLRQDCPYLRQDSEHALPEHKSYCLSQHESIFVFNSSCFSTTACATEFS